MNAVAAINARLATVFAPLDAEVLAGSIAWGLERKAALNEFQNSEERIALRRDQSKLYAKMFDICGGKSWYNVFNNNSDARIIEFIAKNCAATIAKRNATIANKLAKAGVTEVLGEEFSHSVGGFNGVFRLNTDAGHKNLRIETIYAGGYNIQCLHLRVLVKIK